MNDPLVKAAQAVVNRWYGGLTVYEQIGALRAELAAPQASTVEPVAWRKLRYSHDMESWFEYYDECRATNDTTDCQPLYLHPPAQVAPAAEAAPAVAALCACKDRPADKCPGEWEPGCDLGANEKHVAVQEAPNAQLMRFYGVETTQALIDAMERHITRLQAKLPGVKDLPALPNGGRQG